MIVVNYEAEKLNSFFKLGYNYDKKRWESDCATLHPYRHPRTYCDFCRF